MEVLTVFGRSRKRYKPEQKAGAMAHYHAQKADICLPGRDNADVPVTIDWASITNNIIAQTGIDTMQILDTCHAASSVPSYATWPGKANFYLLASSSATGVAGVNELAFTKAIIHKLAPADGQLPANFTALSLYTSLPAQNVAYAEYIGDEKMRQAMLSAAYRC